MCFQTLNLHPAPDGAEEPWEFHGYKHFAPLEQRKRTFRTKPVGVVTLGRIEDVFADLKRRGKKGFIPFITAGDPDLDTTEELLVTLSQSGATLIELGVPF